MKVENIKCHVGQSDGAGLEDEESLDGEVWLLGP